MERAIAALVRTTDGKIHHWGEQPPEAFNDAFLVLMNDIRFALRQREHAA
jgi:hypothetical protein